MVDHRGARQVIVETSVGPIACWDVGTGPPVLLLHGMHMTGSLWRDVVDRLSLDHRCVVPTLPLGAHPVPLPAGTDRTLSGVAQAVAEIIIELDLTGVTVVGNDTGGALIQIALDRLEPHVHGLILVACEAYDNFPPGLPGRVSWLSARMPGGLLMAAWAMAVPGFDRLPVSWGWMTKHGLPPDLRRDWFTPLRTSRGVRDDIRQVIRSINPDLLTDAARQFAGFDKPVLVVWSPEDRVMPQSHADRLVEAFPRAHRADVTDSYTLVPLDQPEHLARLIRGFVAADSTSTSPSQPTTEDP